MQYSETDAMIEALSVIVAVRDGRAKLHKNRLSGLIKRLKAIIDSEENGFDNDEIRED